MNIKNLFLFILLVFLSGCATKYVPPLDGSRAKLIIPSKKQVEFGYRNAYLSISVGELEIDRCGFSGYISQERNQQSRTYIPADRVICVEITWHFSKLEGNYETTSTCGPLKRQFWALPDATYELIFEFINDRCYFGVEKNN